ncbi:MAG: hypothetical protein JNL38_38590 [Myxococcales bacterium]|jgi:hypothetical protein|nr:hypothetical protein [Myxococcales bacterium]
MHDSLRPGVAAALMITLATANIGIAVACGALSAEPVRHHGAVVPIHPEIGSPAPRMGNDALLIVVGTVAAASAAALLWASDRIVRARPRA